jgi:hypothetical protein
MARRCASPMTLLGLKPESRLWCPPLSTSGFLFLCLVIPLAGVYTRASRGVWRSWLARCVWDAEVPGSSPGTPTAFWHSCTKLGTQLLNQSDPVRGFSSLAAGFCFASSRQSSDSGPNNCPARLKSDSSTSW